jgi:DNA-binding transcriptional MerR regulator
MLPTYPYLSPVDFPTPKLRHYAPERTAALNARARFCSMFAEDGVTYFSVNESPSFPIGVAAKITRVAQTTLVNWNTRGILVPSITPPRPHPSFYTFRDLVAIRVLVALREGGIDPRGLKRVVVYLRKRKGLSSTEALASTVLITDGRDVYEVDGSASMVSALRRPGQAVFHAVALSTLVTEVQRDTLAALKAA